MGQEVHSKAVEKDESANVYGEARTHARLDETPSFRDVNPRLAKCTSSTVSTCYKTEKYSVVKSCLLHIAHCILFCHPPKDAQRVGSLDRPARLFCRLCVVFGVHAWKARVSSLAVDGGPNTKRVPQPRQPRPREGNNTQRMAGTSISGRGRNPYSFRTLSLIDGTTSACHDVQWQEYRVRYKSNRIEYWLHCTDGIIDRGIEGTEGGANYVQVAWSCWCSWVV